jgi:hypothetical protein
LHSKGLMLIAKPLFKRHYFLGFDIIETCASSSAHKAKRS